MPKHNFNYINVPTQPHTWGSTSTCTKQHIHITKHEHFIVYDFYDPKPFTICHSIKSKLFCMISTTNPAHTFSEIMSCIQYYKKQPGIMIAFSEHIQRYLPHLYELLLLFIPESNVELLLDDHIYYMEDVTLYNPHHFNYVINWSNFPFVMQENRLIFKDLLPIIDTMLIPMKEFQRKMEEIYNTHHSNYLLYDNIMLLKFDSENSTTPDRGFSNLSIEVSELLKKHQIQRINPSQFKNIYEYICVLYHAKNVYFSYGGPCCTNRFFVNPMANVYVLTCKTYQQEYEYNNQNKHYWHVRHSHLCPVPLQVFFLNMNKDITLDEMNKVILSRFDGI